MIIQKADPICYKSNPLPHGLSGELQIGIVEPGTVANISFTGCSLEVSKTYQATADEPGILSIVIPEADACWFTAFEECCYKVHVKDGGGCSIPFTVSGIEVECIRMCLQIDCEATGPYALTMCAEEVEEINNCNVC